MAKTTTEQFRKDLLKRIDERLHALNMTRNAAELKAFGKPGTIRNWARPDKNVLPRVDSIEALVPVLRTNLQWLMRGEGSPDMTSSMIASFDPDAVESDEMIGVNGFSRGEWSPTKEGALPEVDTRLGAGEGTVGEAISLPVGPMTVSSHSVVAEWVLPMSYLRNEAKVQPSQTIVMEIVGDSMSPTYHPGDRVLVDLSQNRMVSDTVYAISDGHAEPQIKRLQRVPFSEPPRVKIISDNPALETFEVDLERLTVIGRICGHIARK